MKIKSRNFIKVVLDIIVGHIYNSCPNGIFGGFVYVIDLQFPENIFAVSIDGVKTQVAFGGNFFGCFAQSNQLKYFPFGRGQSVFFNRWFRSRFARENIKCFAAYKTFSTGGLFQR